MVLSRGKSLGENWLFSAWLHFSSSLPVFPSLHLTSICPALSFPQFGFGDNQNCTQWVINILLLNGQHWYKLSIWFPLEAKHPCRFGLESFFHPLTLYCARTVKQGGLWRWFVDQSLPLKGRIIVASEGFGLLGYSKSREKGLLTPFQASPRSTRKDTYQALTEFKFPQYSRSLVNLF